ncbi:helix-turn-helix domain-containing protein [Spongiimicrobium sp. 3-5]|uniref:helix-turn-helix domain-containing protein n=1 Tax=Spongiimicrobium sp. 3-5 TaxID=3332596 RepID=UPI00398157F6
MKKNFPKQEESSVLRISTEVELILGTIGAVQSFFVSAYLFFGKKRNTTNLLLVFFFLMITLRIVKSLAWVYLDSVPAWFLNLGFMAHVASGPALFLYLYYFLHNKKWKVIAYIHFIPAIGLLLLLFRLTGDNFWHFGGYTALLYHQIVYAVGSLAVLVHGFINRKKLTVYLDRKQWLWLALLMMGAASIQLAYFSNYVLGLVPYMAGPMIYALFIYVIAFFGMLNHQLFNQIKPANKYRNINIDPKEFERIHRRIATFLEKEKPYLDDAFSLEKLSKAVSFPSYLTSYVINKGFSTNFSDLINAHRIKTAKTMLRSSDFQHIKISEVAYECGFSSLSSFNAAFKKQTGTTPSQYKKDQ